MFIPRGRLQLNNRTEILTSELVLVYIYNPSTWELKASLGYLPSSRLACTIKDDVSKKKKKKIKGQGDWKDSKREGLS